jgi:membrane-bound inhibitor of C-type lysozyme
VTNAKFYSTGAVNLVCSFALASAAYANSTQQRACGSSQLRIDLERDGKLDCVVTQTIGSDAVLKLQLSSSGAWVVLGRYKHSDETLTVLPLAEYRNPRFTAPHKGDAIRLTFPEKSSVLYYWDEKKSAVAEFWEAD